MILNDFTGTHVKKPEGFASGAISLENNYNKAFESYLGNSIIHSEKFMLNLFNQLNQKWKEETRFVSSGTKLFSNAAYQEIITLGKTAIPFIIDDLIKTNSHWFYALNKITDKNPVPNEHMGQIEEMKKDWVDWAKKEGYV